jgi:hypothetical protein
MGSSKEGSSLDSTPSEDTAKNLGRICGREDRWIPLVRPHKGWVHEDSKSNVYDWRDI